MSYGYEADWLVYDEGSIVLFTANTDVARDYIRDNDVECQWPRSIVVHPGAAQEVGDNLIDEGMVVRWA